MNERQARIQRVRDRNWRRYVKHWCHANTTCRYGAACRIASQANQRDARLACAQLRAATRQMELFA